jgi:hypothetical protein
LNPQSTPQFKKVALNLLMITTSGINNQRNQWVMAGSPLKRARREAGEGATVSALAVTPRTGRVIPAGRGRPAICSDPAQLDAIAGEYLDKCEAEEDPPILNILAILAGYLNWHSLSGSSGLDKNHEMAEAVARARAGVERWYVRRSMRPGLAQGAGFALKNYCGWTDKIESNQHVTIEGGDLGQRLTAALQARTIDGTAERIE